MYFFVLESSARSIVQLTSGFLQLCCTGYADTQRHPWTMRKEFAAVGTWQSYLLMLGWNNVFSPWFLMAHDCLRLTVLSCSISIMVFLPEYRYIFSKVISLYPLFSTLFI